MVGMVPEALRHSTAEVAALLEAPTMLALGHEVGDLWRAPLLALLQAGTGVLLEGLAAPWPTHAMAEVAALQALRRPGDVRVGERACCALAPRALRHPQALQAVLRVPHKPRVDLTPARPP